MGNLFSRSSTENTITSERHRDYSRQPGLSGYPSREVDSESMHRSRPDTNSRSSTENTITSEGHHDYIRQPELSGYPSHGVDWENMNRSRPVTNSYHKVIGITNIDLAVSNNTEEHHTDEFEITNRLVNNKRKLLVVRRGQTFNVNLEFDRDFDKDTEDLRFVFQFGRNPHPADRTHVEVVLSSGDVSDKWGAYIQSTDYKSISLALMTPPTCPVGMWRINIDVIDRHSHNTTALRYNIKDPIYILFNPWCKNDQVYFHESEETLLDEYVLKETGKLYGGSADSITAMHWDFGQFTGSILDCVLYLLETLADDARGEPVQVCRKLSALINSPDDNGVLTGNWSGSYYGGTAPLDWAGSVAILNEYFQTKRPVRYGQCWVFSGLLTTACRALGIPTRSVTNYNSAHDTDGSITIDTFEDQNGEPIKKLNKDSIWNFHVWTEVWMARPDLPLGYGGWQAIDATPQEASNGLYRLGPTSVEAVKRGEVTLPYDGKFVFAEVNADSVKLVQDENGEFIAVSINKTKVGKFLSTKKPFSQDREDVTEQYKYPEGSDEERAAVQRANMASSSNHELYKPAAAEDVTFEFRCPPVTLLGETISVTLKMTNTSTDDRTINGTLLLSSMYYTGVSYKVIEKRKIDDLILKSNEDKEINIEVAVDDYFDKLMDHCMCKISSTCFVKETKQISSEMKELTLRKPQLDIKAPVIVFVDEIFEVDVSFVNPLPMKLTKCELRVEGPQLQRPITYKQKDVGGHKTFTGKFEMAPRKPGQREIIVYFNCMQISAINSSHVVTIAKK